MKTSPLILLVLGFVSLALAGCDFEVPPTANPTRNVDERLLGLWTTYDREDKKDLPMTVRRYDASNYVVSLDRDIYRAFHADGPKLKLLCIEDLNSSHRKFILYSWSLSADGKTLKLRRVLTDVIDDSATTSSALQADLEAHAADPKLLGPELEFQRSVAK